MALYSAVITLADGSASYDDMDMHVSYIEAMYDSEAMNVAGHLLRGRVMMDTGDYDLTPEERAHAAASKLVIRVSRLSDPEDITKSALVAVGAVTIDGADVRGLNTPKRFKHDPEGAKKWREEGRADKGKRNTVQWTRAEPLKNIRTGEAKIGTLSRRWRGPSLPPGYSHGGMQASRARLYDILLNEEGIAFAAQHGKKYDAENGILSAKGINVDEAKNELIAVIEKAHGFKLTREHLFSVSSIEIGGDYTKRREELARGSYGQLYNRPESYRK